MGGERETEQDRGAGASCSSCRPVLPAFSRYPCRPVPPAYLPIP